MATLHEISKVVIDLFERCNAQDVEVTSGTNKIRISKKDYKKMIIYPQRLTLIIKKYLSKYLQT